MAIACSSQPIRARSVEQGAAWYEWRTAKVSCQHNSPHHLRPSPQRHRVAVLRRDSRRNNAQTPLNVAPCRRYSDNSPVGTEYGTARSRRSTLRASVVSWLHCSSQPSTHVPHQKIGKNRNRADLQSANPLAGGSSPAAPLPNQSCSPAQPCVSASRRRPNSRPGRPVRAGLQRRCVLSAQR